MTERIIIIEDRDGDVLRAPATGDRLHLGHASVWIPTDRSRRRDPPGDQGDHETPAESKSVIRSAGSPASCSSPSCSTTSCSADTTDAADRLAAG